MCKAPGGGKEPTYLLRKPWSHSCYSTNILYPQDTEGENLIKQTNKTRVTEIALFAMAVSALCYMENVLSLFLHKYSTSDPYKATATVEGALPWVP